MDDILLAQHNSSHSTQPHSIIAKSLVLCKYIRKKKFNSKIRQNPKVDVFEDKIVLQSNIIISTTEQFQLFEWMRNLFVSSAFSEETNFVLVNSLTDYDLPIRTLLGRVVNINIQSTDISGSHFNLLLRLASFPVSLFISLSHLCRSIPLSHCLNHVYDSYVRIVGPFIRGKIRRVLRCIAVATGKIHMKTSQEQK